MIKPRILVVEDETKVAGFIQRGLEEHNFDVDIAYDGLIGKKIVMSTHYDVVILDINLPSINGFELCQILREEGIKYPILMLTALGTTEDKLTGFEAGADDYLVKPFEFAELLARIRALLKRSHNYLDIPKIFIMADLEINFDSKIVKRGNIRIDLTAKEFSLLEYFAKNKGKVLSRAKIAEKIWEISFNTGTNVIDVYVNFLRKKVDKDFSNKLIHTVVGTGYVLKEED